MSLLHQVNHFRTQMRAFVRRLLNIKILNINLLNIILCINLTLRCSGTPASRLHNAQQQYVWTSKDRCHMANIERVSTFLTVGFVLLYNSKRDIGHPQRVHTHADS